MHKVITEKLLLNVAYKIVAIHIRNRIKEKIEVIVGLANKATDFIKFSF